MMATETAHICDGCDALVVGDLPGSWATVKIEVGSDKPSDDQMGDDAVFDLCGNCRNKLQGHVNPRNWVRVVAAREA